ncbi:MAG: helix-turn-helix domain-containing protein [Oscillospiraceae bacterium]|jgi:transcriptional regulator with XRE-family HTH domain|nr:helix-turn-helix domain-containing protein [Oscillospiraceae bacterium]
MSIYAIVVYRAGNEIILTGAKENEMTQVDLVNRLGISRSAVNAWEMGISKPHINHIIELSKIFSVTTDYLLMVDDARHLLDISDLSEREKKVMIDLAAALRDKN